MQPNNNILIEVSGGIVTAVYSSDVNMHVTVIDHDILKEEGEPKVNARAAADELGLTCEVY